MSMPPNGPQHPGYGGAPLPPPNGPQYPSYGMPPPAPKKRNPLLVGCLGCGGLAVALFVVAGIVGAVTGAGKGTSNTATPPAASAPTATASKKAVKKPAKHVPGIGEEARDGKFAFTVTKVKRGIKRVGDQYFGQDAQGQYVEVFVNVSNISNKPQSFFGANQKLFIGNQQYDADNGAAMYLPDSKSLYEPINPGNAVAGIVLFDVPPGAKPTKIELHDSAFSGGVTVNLR